MKKVTFGPVTSIDNGLGATHRSTASSVSPKSIARSQSTEEISNPAIKESASYFLPSQVADLKWMLSINKFDKQQQGRVQRTNSF